MQWIYKNRGVGMLSATASLGLVLLWDVEGGLTQIDKFLYSNEDYIKVAPLADSCTSNPSIHVGCNASGWSPVGVWCGEHGREERV